jgi:hypothetical protein
VSSKLVAIHVGGVGYEKMIVTADLLEKIGSKRVIPIVRQNGTVHLPTFLRTKMYIDLSTEDLFESGMDELLRDLLSAPLFIKPPLGTDPFKVVTGTAQPSTPSPANQLMEALAKVYEQSDDDGCLRIQSAPCVRIVVASSDYRHRRGGGVKDRQ